MRTMRVVAALLLAVAIVGCDVRSSEIFNSVGPSYLDAAVGTAEITKFGPNGNRLAWYDTLPTEPWHMNIQGYQQLDNHTCTLSLAIREPREGRTYVLGPTGSEAYAIYTSADFPKLLLRSFSSRENGGTLVLTRLDQEHRLIEGTFQFVARNNVQFSQDPATPDSIRVTNGRFRLAYDVVATTGRRGSD